MKKTITLVGIDLDVQLTLAMIVSTICGTIVYYRNELTGIWDLDRFLLYFVIPVLIVIVPFNESVKMYGVQLGRWKEGIIWTISVCAIMSLVLYGFTRSPEVQQYYSAKANEIHWVVAKTALEMFGWEFLWRGLMLFTFAKRFGIGAALWLQAIPFSLLHLGKPELETISTIFGGVGFGFIAWRTQSMLYPWLIHTFMGVCTILLVMYF